jgi:hypothetical protein
MIDSPFWLGKRGIVFYEPLQMKARVNKHLLYSGEGEELVLCRLPSLVLAKPSHRIEVVAKEDFRRMSQFLSLTGQV